jgi:hypothetical protein
MKKYICFYFDWKEFSDEAEHGFRQAVKFLGGHVYNDPQCTGTDTYGFIVSKEKLTKKEINQISKYNFN